MSFTRNARVVAFADLEKIMRSVKGRKVLVGGCFDLLHVGHIRFLSAAKKQGDKLIILLESDESIKLKKKRSPFYPQADRAEILSALAMVDHIIMLPFLKTYDEYLNLVKLIKPTVVAVTQGDPRLACKKKQAELAGGAVAVVIERINGYNSSETIKKTAV